MVHRPAGRAKSATPNRHAKIVRMTHPPRLVAAASPTSATSAASAWLASALLGCLLALGAAPAAALDPPTGKVVLTLTGKLAARNGPDGATFDIGLLERLPRHSFTTKTPWYSKPRKFTGVLLRDLLDAVGSTPARVNATALNDYRVEIPVEDVARGHAMLAYLLDDQPMSVREKGPLVIIYPFDDKPELRSAVHYSRAIWQLRALEIQ
jgi:hypothetical protein